MSSSIWIAIKPVAYEYHASNVQDETDSWYWPLM